MIRVLFLLLLSISFLFAEEFDEVAFYEEAASFQPFGVNGTYLNVQKAKFRTAGFENQHIRYIQSDAAFAYTHPCSPCYGFILGAGWVGTDVDMEDNPEFDETCFNYVSFSFGGFTKGLNDWLWTATFSILLDTQEIDLTEYALYQGVLWGKYTFSSCFEFDVGLILEVGLNKEKIWPIIGFIYIPNPCTRLHIVYPVDITLEYDFYHCLTAAASVRFLRNRHRVLSDNINPKAIFEYRTTGVEFDLLYTPFTNFLVKGFIGTTLEGDFKVSDKHDKNSTHYKFKGSPYAGASAVLSF